MFHYCAHITTSEYVHRLLVEVNMYSMLIAIDNSKLSSLWTE
jgi:hypothetical protein